jgi:uncharacterized phiE125 gp8 family phage protein
MPSLSPLVPDSAMLDGARAYLRIDQQCDDPSLVAILLAAIAHAESVTGQIMIQRTARQILPSNSHWQRLSATPVSSIGTVKGLPADGAAFAIDAANYSARIDANNDGYISVRQPGAAGRVEIEYQAGLAQSWSDLPESLRLAILRLTGHLYVGRDDPADAGPPAAVAALLRPWRRMRLSA